MKYFNLIFLLLVFFTGCSQVEINYDNTSITSNSSSVDVKQNYLELNNNVYSLIKESFPNDFKGYSLGKEAIFSKENQVLIAMTYRKEGDFISENDIQYILNFENKSYEIVKENTLSSFRGSFFEKSSNGVFVLYTDCGREITWFTNNTFDVVKIIRNDIENYDVYQEIIKEFPVDVDLMNQLHEEINSEVSINIELCEDELKETNTKRELIEFDPEIVQVLIEESGNEKLDQEDYFQIVFRLGSGSKKINQNNLIISINDTIILEYEVTFITNQGNPNEEGYFSNGDLVTISFPYEEKYFHKEESLVKLGVIENLDEIPIKIPSSFNDNLIILYP